MTQYVLKRLLLMVPTFLMITVVVFVVINLAPGRPGGSAGVAGSQDAQQSANAREGYRLFKEQYYLDKPIILNFRFLLGREDVERQLETIARNMSFAISGEEEALSVGQTAASILTSMINIEYARIDAMLRAPAIDDARRAELRRELQNTGYERLDPIRPDRPPQARIRDAEESVEDWGDEIVPELLAIAQDYVHVVPSDSDDPWFDGRGESAAELGIDRLAGEIEIDGHTLVINTVLTRKVRFLAVQRLSINARRAVMIRDGERGDELQEAQNRAIVSENNAIAAWTYPIEATEQEIDAVVETWARWYADNADRYEKDTGAIVAQVFTSTRFARYWGNLARLDLGTSIRYRRPVIEVIADHWQYSIFLSISALILAYFISIPLGVLAAVRQNRFADRGIGVFLFVLYSLPSFFAASLLQTNITGASEHDLMQWFPVSGFYSADPLEATTWERMWDVAWHLVLPVACLTYTSLAVLSRYARTGLLDVIRSDYIRTARAKGLSEWVVIVKHAVRNGMIPILTLLGTTLPVLIGGSIIIEYIFVIDGMGKLMITAIQFRDYNVIMGILLLSSVLTLIGILASDISYALVDPRISFD